MRRRPAYYGHKKVGVFQNDTMPSNEIETSLLEFSESNATLHQALTAIFESPEWRTQNAPVKKELLQHPAVRGAEVRDANGKWYPCQLGCPNGIPLSGTQTQTRQPAKATEHVEWHLGMWRFACPVWYVYITSLFPPL